MKTLDFFSKFRNQDIRVFIPLIGLLGIFCLGIPSLARLEMDIGLEWLFLLRGERTAPRQVTIVTIDKQSSRALELPNHPRKWPRNLHGELVDQLSKQGAAVIAFDIIFAEERHADQDRKFADAMQRNANVVLFDYLESENANGVHLQKHLPPIPLFEQAAIATSPFALPKVPEQIKQAWLFKKGAGEIPTIPVVMLVRLMSPVISQFNLLINDALINLNVRFKLPAFNLASSRPDLAASTYYQLFSEHPEAIPQLANKINQVSNPQIRKQLTALLTAFTVGDGIVLDFYGPPHSIQTIPYHEILAGKKFDLQGSAVLVGYSEHLQPEQKDGFYTVFTDEAGLDISGVEIMATTLANLIEARSVVGLSLWQKISLVILFGLLTGWILTRFSGYRAISIAVLIGITYLGIAIAVFTSKAIWVPVTTPLLFQLPVALLLALTTQYLSAKKQREHLDVAFRRYLPASIADSAITQSHEVLVNKKRKIYATCLATDMIAYSRLAETLSTTELHEHLNRYFQLMFPKVYETGGMVIDVVGDAMLAIWHEGDKHQIKQNALNTAIAIRDQLDLDDKFGFPTRIGLHCGEVSLGSVGGGEHFEYRAVGDVVNTTTRIEQLNKLLGTQLLASGETLQLQTPAESRYLGRFLLRGKTQPLDIYEVRDSASRSGQASDKQFNQALELFKSGDFVPAEKLFHATHQASADPVASFYIGQCRQLQHSPADEQWNGTIIVK